MESRERARKNLGWGSRFDHYAIISCLLFTVNQPVGKYCCPWEGWNCGLWSEQWHWPAYGWSSLTHRWSCRGVAKHRKWKWYTVNIHLINGASAKIVRVLDDTDASYFSLHTSDCYELGHDVLHEHNLHPAITSTASDTTEHRGRLPIEIQLVAPSGVTMRELRRPSTIISIWNTTGNRSSGIFGAAMIHTVPGDAILIPLEHFFREEEMTICNCTCLRFSRATFQFLFLQWVVTQLFAQPEERQQPWLSARNLCVVGWCLVGLWIEWWMSSAAS